MYTTYLESTSEAELVRSRLKFKHKLQNLKSLKKHVPEVDDQCQGDQQSQDDGDGDVQSHVRLRPDDAEGDDDDDLVDGGHRLKSQMAPLCL